MITPGKRYPFTEDEGYVLIRNSMPEMGLGIELAAPDVMNVLSPATPHNCDLHPRSPPRNVRLPALDGSSPLPLILQPRTLRLRKGRLG